jgi:hypothetical protein
MTETKIITTSQTKNAQARQTSGFGIFTSPETNFTAVPEMDGRPVTKCD